MKCRFLGSNSPGKNYIIHVLAVDVSTYYNVFAFSKELFKGT